MTDVEVHANVPTAPEQVWDLVSDVTRMGEWSPENTGGRWLGGATGPEVGVRFKGSNQKGIRRWSTTCTVTAAERGKAFAFDVHYAGVPISSWSYEFRPEGDGTAVTESWTDRRPTWMKLGSIPVMGVADRAAHNRRNMEATLAALRTAALRDA